MLRVQLFNPFVTEELKHVIVAVENAGEFSNDFLEFSQTADLRAMNINPQRAVLIQGRCAQSRARVRRLLLRRSHRPVPCTR